MKRRYILAPQAARDLVEIWRYIRKESSQQTCRSPIMCPRLRPCHSIEVRKIRMVGPKLADTR
jgi:hypothetical protein